MAICWVSAATATQAKLEECHEDAEKNVEDAGESCTRTDRGHCARPVVLRYDRSRLVPGIVAVGDLEYRRRPDPAPQRQE